MAEPDMTMTPELSLAIELHQQGRLAEAEAAYRAVLRTEPQSFIAIHQIGLIELQREEFTSAYAWVQRALQIEPEFATGYLTLGAIERELGHFEASAAALDQAIERMPQNPKAFASRAFTFLKLQRHREAINDFRQALSFGVELADWRHGLGVCLQAIDDFDGALPQYQRAVALNPSLVKAWFNAGLIHYERKRWVESLDCFERALQLEPTDDTALGNCAELSEKLGRHDESLALYQKLVHRQPRHAVAHYNIGHEWHRRNEFDLALRSYNRALDIDPHLTDARGNRIFILQTTGRPVTEVRAEAIEYGRLASEKARPKFTSWAHPKTDTALRVGLVSADLRNHSVGSLLVSVLPELVKQGIELFAYQVGGRDDTVTEQMRPAFAAWRKLESSDAEDAVTIHDDGVQILIDLSGYTRGSRLPLFSHRPAPIQVTWLGYWGTTGLPEMDYLLGDPFSTPASDDGHYTERVWRLPQTRWCFCEPVDSPEVGPLPYDRNGDVTFGLFNHYRKFTPQLLDLWCQVLHAIPGSRALVKNSAFRDARFLTEAAEAFKGRGIEGERLMLEGPEARARFLARLNDIDLCLDTFPAAGGLTTLDSLWMGAPVVSWRGQDMLSRQGELVLSNLDLESWLAKSPSDYLQLAIAKAKDVDRLRQLRPVLRERLQHSPVMDAPRFAKDLATALRQMWSEHRAIRAD